MGVGPWPGWYISGEHAYQTQKTVVVGWAQAIMAAPAPWQAKRVGQLCEIRLDWDELRVSVMREVLAAKFTPEREEGVYLLGTGNEELIEHNWWGDTYWGVCRGRGANVLGRLLMERRKELR